MSDPRLTTEATLVPTSHAPYRRLRVSDGEAHAVRRDLAPQGRDETEVPSAARPDTVVGHHLAGILHFTDFQLADLASPSRVEFMQRLNDVPTWAGMVPAYRPQEFMQAQAIEAIVRSLNAVQAEDPARWDLGLTTGDNTDSAQRNELTAFLTSLDGGDVHPAAGTREFEDAPVGLGDPEYYNPEPGHENVWTQQHGLPRVPGAVAAAARPFATNGLTFPWLSCFGNHDCLVQGRAAAPEGYDAFLTAEKKPVSIDPDNAPEGDKLAAYLEDPTWTAAGESTPILASEDRTMVSKADYVAAHLASPGLPGGHGFTADNRAASTAYYVWDQVPGVRFIVLDTTNLAGHVDGCVDRAQFAWLDARIAEVEPGGSLEERAVVLASHHGLSTMTNGYGDEAQVHLADDVESLLHRHPNVVAWLSGHTHVNKITPRPGAAAETGFWEISTGSIAEWPVQFRGVELQLAPESPAVLVRTTMVDSQVPAAPDGSLDVDGLASLHREIAANHAGSVGGLDAQGTPDDRNQVLVAPVSTTLAAALRQVVDAD